MHIGFLYAKNFFIASNIKSNVHLAIKGIEAGLTVVLFANHIKNLVLFLVVKLAWAFF